MVKLIDDMWPIPEQEIRKYVERVISDMHPDQLHDFLTRKHSYSRAIKEKITQLSEEHAEEKFKKMLNAGTIEIRHDYKLPQSIVPGRLGPDLSGSLYEREGDMSDFETRIISGVAGLSNVAFWHRNLGRGKGFAINGFKSNHYPDFIVVTKAGTIILLETKGSHLDNPDTNA
jgi:type III restriction enzyme